MSSPEWETLEPGVKVFRLWESMGPKQPQIAVFRLSSKKYRELRRDPKAFVDDHKIFPEPVRPGARLTQMIKAPKEYAGVWIVTSFHRESRCRCASFPAKVD